MEYFLEEISGVMSKDFIVLRPADTAGKALHLMRDGGVSAVLVKFEEKIGLVDGLHLLKAGNFPNAKLGSLAEIPPTFVPSDTVLKVSKALVSHRVDTVPVLGSNGEVLGVVGRIGIVRHAFERGWLEGFKTKDFMMTSPVTAHPSVTASEIRRLIVKNGVRQVLILKGDGELIGMVKIGDILEKIYSIAVRRSTRGEVVGETDRTLSHKAKTIMSRPVATIGVDDELSKAAEIIIRGEHCVPVLEDMHLVGVITSSNIVKAIAELDVMPSLPVSFKGLEKIPGHLHERVNVSVSRTLERFARTTDLFEGRIVVKHQNVEGERTFYTFEVSVSVANNMFLASESGWEPVQALSKALRSLERQSEKVLVKRRKARRRRTKKRR